MKPNSRANAAIQDYAGLVTNSGPVVADANAGQCDDLVNLTPVRQGELVQRPGFSRVQFDEE